MTKKTSKPFFVAKNRYHQQTKKVFNLLVENFSKSFFVGGSVRNYIWGKPIADFDIVTTATPTQVAKVLNLAGLKLDLSASQFGVVVVKVGTKDIQITTLRTDQYSDSRFPKIKFTQSIALDVKRRDFTINSLYFNAKTLQLFDPLNSKDDLNKKVLRSIGDPKTKFQQDPLRIIRGWRFAKTYQLKIEPQTLLAMNELEQLTKQLTKAKIKKEINFATSQNVKKFLTKKFV